MQLSGRRITLHGLRHAFAANWLSAGSSIISLVSILGYRPSFPTIREFASSDQRFSVDSDKLTRIAERPE